MMSTVQMIFWSSAGLIFCMIVGAILVLTRNDGDNDND